MFRSKNAWILALVVALAAAPAMARVDFTPIEGGEFLVPQDFADDGTLVLVHYFGAPYFTWTKEGGLVNINGGCPVGSVQISDDGSVITGNIENVELGVCEAAKYLGNGEWQGMGNEPGGVNCDSSYSSVFGMSDDGSKAVGLFWTAQKCRAIGGTFDVAAGVATERLESSVPDRPTRGNAATFDGSTVVGWQDLESGQRVAAKWVNGVQELILSDNGEYNGEAIVVNDTGTAMAGVFYEFGPDQWAWSWREGRGFASFGQGSRTSQGGGGNIQTVPTAMSEDGSVVAGVVTNFTAFTRRAFVWSEDKGFRFLDDIVRGKTAAGWSLDAIGAMSEDGSVLAGYGVNPDGEVQAWVMDLQSSGPRP